MKGIRLYTGDGKAIDPTSPRKWMESVQRLFPEINFSTPWWREPLPSWRDLTPPFPDRDDGIGAQTLLNEQLRANLEMQGKLERVIDLLPILETYLRGTTNGQMELPPSGMANQPQMSELSVKERSVIAVALQVYPEGRFPETDNASLILYKLAAAWPKGPGAKLPCRKVVHSAFRKAGWNWPQSKAGGARGKKRATSQIASKVPK